MTRNKELFIMGERADTTKDRIVFFDATGNIMTSNILKYNKKIVCFDFLESELLFILLDNGKYLLINPFNGN